MMRSAAFGTACAWLAVLCFSGSLGAVERNGREQLRGLEALEGALEQPPTPTYLKTLMGKNGDESPRVEDRKTDARLESRIDRVGRAFDQNDAQRLEPNLHPNNRIRISLKSSGDGYFRRSQVMFMFEDLFDERETQSFAFEPVELDSREAQSAHVHAQWSYQLGDDEVTEHLRFKLERHNDDWYISEIISVPR